MSQSLTNIVLARMFVRPWRTPKHEEEAVLRTVFAQNERIPNGWSIARAPAARSNAQLCSYMFAPAPGIATSTKLPQADAALRTTCGSNGSIIYVLRIKADRKVERVLSRNLAEYIRTDNCDHKFFCRTAMVENLKRSGRCRDSVYSNIMPSALKVWELTTARQSKSPRSRY